MRILIVALLLIPLFPAQAHGGLLLLQEDFSSLPGYTFLDSSFLIHGPVENVSLRVADGVLTVRALPYGGSRYLHLSPLVPAGRCTVTLGLGIAAGSYPLFLMLLGPEDRIPGGRTYSYIGIYIYNYPRNSTNAYFMVMDPATGQWSYGGRLAEPYARHGDVPLRELQIEVDSRRSLVRVSSGSSFAMVPYPNGEMRLPGPGDVYAVLGADGGVYAFDFVREEAPPGDPITVLPHLGRVSLGVAANDGSSRDAWGLSRIPGNFTLFVELGTGSEADVLSEYDPCLFIHASPADMDWPEARSLILDQLRAFTARYGSPPDAVLFSGRSNISIADFLWWNYGIASLRQSSRHWVLLSSENSDFVELLLRAGEPLNVYLWVPVNATDPAYDPALRLTWEEFSRLWPLLRGDPSLDVFMDDWSSCNGEVLVLDESPLTFALLGPSSHFQILLPPGSEGGILVSPIGHFLAQENGVFSVPRGTYTLDLLPPTVEILAPRGEPSNATLVRVDLDLWDDVGIGELSFYVDGTLVLRTDPVHTVFVPVPDGMHVLTVEAVDGAGRTSSASTTVRVDRVPPIVGGVPRAVNTPYLNFTLVVRDPSGVETVEWRVDGGEWVAGTRVKYGPLEEGYHVLDVRAMDAAGNWAYGSYGIRVDLTGPELRILYPSPGAEVRNPVAVVWDGDAVSYRLFVDGEEVEAHHGAVLKLAPGRHEIRLVGYDDLGNCSEAVVEFTVLGGLNPWPLVVAAIAALVLIGIKALRD